MLSQSSLIERFNRREIKAFEEIYLMYYRELYLYAAMLYKGTTVMAEDILQDIFTELWSSTSRFSHPLKIKGYIYTAIKNDFKNFLSHEKYVSNFQDAVKRQDNVDVFECEVYSELDNILKLLPRDYADVISLLLEGFKPAEIAKKLGRSPQTIYNARHESVKLLKSMKINSDLFTLLLLLIKI